MPCAESRLPASAPGCLAATASEAPYCRSSDPHAHNDPPPPGKPSAGASHPYNRSWPISTESPSTVNCFPAVPPVPDVRHVPGLRKMAFLCIHDSILSNNGVSGKPGAVRAASKGRLCFEAYSNNHSVFFLLATPINPIKPVQNNHKAGGIGT